MKIRDWLESDALAHGDHREEMTHPRQLATQVVELFEDFLTAKGIKIPNYERDENSSVPLVVTLMEMVEDLMVNDWDAVNEEYGCDVFVASDQERWRQVVNVLGFTPKLREHAIATAAHYVRERMLKEEGLAVLYGMQYEELVSDATDRIQDYWEKL